MFGHQLSLPDTFGCDERMVGYAVERVEQLRDSGHGEGVANSGVPYAEMLNNLGIFWQFHRRTVNGLQDETVPCHWIGMFVEKLDRFCVEFDERLGLVFFFALQRAALETTFWATTVPERDLPELVEFGLVGAFDQVAEIEDQCGKRQFSVATEV